MSSIPADIRYTESHEYLKPTADPSVFAVGVTDFAQGELGDVVYLDLPKPGATYGAHDSFGTIEAVKAVSDIYAPVAGEVVEVNPRLEGEPSLVNSDPYGEGWMIKLKINPVDAATLMDAKAYEAHLAAGGGHH